MTQVWAVVPAAGSGRRFGADVPKQYVSIDGQLLIAHTLDALFASARVTGAMLSLAAGDALWPGWTQWQGRPLLTCTGGGERADSVLAALDALASNVEEDAIVLVHDAARPNLHVADLDALIDAALHCDDGALLAAPVRDTLKRIDADGRCAGTEPRERLWRALTPQAARLGVLRGALRRARADGHVPTDEAMALELFGLRPRLVEGRDDNLKVTTRADLALMGPLLSNRSK